MLPDKQPQDLYAKNANQKQERINVRYHEDLPKKQDQSNGQRPLKPQMLGKDNQVPSKIFKNSGAINNSHYNSQKNLRNVPNGAMGNNRYSSQNMKCGDYDEEEEEQIDEAEMGLDVADEKFSQPTFTEQSQVFSQTQRRGSQRYKDRVHTIRLQSQETYQREHNAGGHTYFTEMQPERKQENGENEDEEFDLFERAQEQIYSQRVQNNKYNFQYSQTEQSQQIQEKGRPKPNKELYNQFQDKDGIDPSTFYHQQKNQSRWDQNQAQLNNQNEQDEEFEQEDQTPKEEMYNFDQANGAHFQYRELLKRLSDITSSSKGNSSAKTKYKKKRNQDLRIPLKEKTQEIVNTQTSQIQKGQTQKKKNQSILEPKNKTFTTNSAKNPKKIEKVAHNQHTQLVNHQIQPSQMLNGNNITQQKLNKLLLTNQENFIEKKLKDIQSQEQTGDKKLQQSMAKNISVVNHKTSGNKTLERVQSSLEQQPQCQINNIKLKTSTQGHSNTSVSSQKHQTPIANNHAKVPISAKPTQICIANSNGPSSINNIFQSTFVNSSVSSGKNANHNQLPCSIQGGNGTFVSGTKCPSSNFLRSATTGLTTSITTKSSAMLTQCNSNKQINQKETPEARQKIRLTAGTTLSSTSKRNTGGTGGAGFGTLSNNSQANTISSKGTQQHCYQSEFDKKSGQNSEQKNLSKNNNSTSGQIGTVQHPSSAPRSNSSHKKVQVKNMMIKNQSFHKNLVNQNEITNTTTIKKCNNDIYNAIFKQIQNTNFNALAGNMKMQPRLSDTKKQTLINQSSKTTRVTGKNSRLSKGSNPGSVNSNSKQRSGERIVNQQSPQSESQSKSQTRKNSKITTRGDSLVNQEKNHSSQPQLNIMNPAAVTSQIQLQKMGSQMMKRMQESNQTTTNQWIKQAVANQQQQQSAQPQQQQSILMNHQVKKQQYGNNMNLQRPLSGNNQNHMHPEQNLIFSRKDSNGQQQQQIQHTLLQLLSERNDNTVIEQSFDNRQSLINQHKTVEKKTNNEQKQNQQINQQHSEKMSKYLQQKKEEMALATSKTTANKKGFLLANIKIQKKANKHQQQTTQETLDRINLPTEEDDLKGNEIEGFYQIQNLMTDHGNEKYSIFEDQNYHQKQQHFPPPASGNRNSVKVKAKNF